VLVLPVSFRETRRSDRLTREMESAPYRGTPAECILRVADVKRLKGPVTRPARCSAMSTTSGVTQVSPRAPRPQRESSLSTRSRPIGSRFLSLSLSLSLSLPPAISRSCLQKDCSLPLLAASVGLSERLHYPLSVLAHHFPSTFVPRVSALFALSPLSPVIPVCAAPRIYGYTGIYTDSRISSRKHDGSDERWKSFVETSPR